MRQKLNFQSLLKFRYSIRSIIRRFECYSELRKPGWGWGGGGGGGVQYFFREKNLFIFSVFYLFTYFCLSTARSTIEHTERLVEHELLLRVSRFYAIFGYTHVPLVLLYVLLLPACTASSSLPEDRLQPSIVYVHMIYIYIYIYMYIHIYPRFFFTFVHLVSKLLQHEPTQYTLCVVSIYIHVYIH